MGFVEGEATWDLGAQEPRRLQAEGFPAILPCVSQQPLKEVIPFTFDKRRSQGPEKGCQEPGERQRLGRALGSEAQPGARTQAQ